MATLDERVTAIEQSLPDIMSKQDMLNLEMRLMGKMDKIQTDMNEGFDGIANNQVWLDKRLARIEEKQGLEPMLGTLWQPSS